MQRLWTAEESQTAIRLDKDGKSDNEIITALNAIGYQRSYVQLRGYLRRKAPEARHNRSKVMHDGVAARRNEALRLVRLGMTANQIALRLNVKPDFVYSHTSKEPRSTGHLFRFEQWLKKIKPSQFVEPDPVVESGKAMLDLESKECRWPIGVSLQGGYRFCGAQCSEGRNGSYCLAHDNAAQRAR